MTPGVRSGLAAAAVLAQTTLIACGLDFDRFDPTDASSETSTSQMPRPGAGPDVTQMPGDDAGATSPSVDVAMAMDVAQPPMDVVPDWGMPVPRDASCTPPANCFTQAQSCGTQCSDQHKQCLSNCGGGNCMRRCDTSEQSCRSQCATQCLVCTSTNGCSDRNDCLGAAGGG
jgi:hypothetical protein